MKQKSGLIQIACGIDLVEYETLARYLRMGEDRFLQRIYTEKEQIYCAGRLSCLAGRFAVKEAVSKALGTGMRGIGWLEIEISNSDNGKPLVGLSGRAASIAASHQLGKWSISISHAEHYAIAIAIVLKQGVTVDTAIENDMSAALTASLEQQGGSVALSKPFDEGGQTINIEGKQ